MSTVVIVGAGQAGSDLAVALRQTGFSDRIVLVAGLPQAGDTAVVRGDPSSKSFSVVHLRNGIITGLHAVNRPRDFTRSDTNPPQKGVPDVPVIRFIEADGTTHPVEAVVGQSLKQAALDHLVPGIIGDCGGCASCGTCHAYIDEQFLPVLPPADENEEMILEGGGGATPLQQPPHLPSPCDNRHGRDGRTHS